MFLWSMLTRYHKSKFYGLQSPDKLYLGIFLLITVSLLVHVPSLFVCEFHVMFVAYMLDLGKGPVLV